jgi:putative transposase
MSIAKRHNMEIISLAIGDDHIHIVVRLPPTLSVCKVFQLLKGAPSFVLFRAIPNFRLRYPRGCLWAIGGGFRSVGDVEKQTVVDYVDRHNQLALTSFI